MRALLLATPLLLAACAASSVRTTVSPAAAARVCAFEVSCVASGVVTAGSSDCGMRFVQLGFGDGADGSTRWVDLELACAPTATDCASWYACLGGGRGTDYCAAHPGGTCDGDTAVGCDSATSRPGAVDCASLGGHCTAVRDFAVCTDGVACEDGVTPSRCDGDFLVACQLGNLEKRIDCGRLFPGGTCAHIESGISVATLCVHDGAPCDPATFASRCEGAVAVSCPLGVEQRLDCASAESTCTKRGSEAPVCTPVADECGLSSTDRCAGDALKVCVNGRYVATPCADLGLRTCLDDGDGVRCIP